MRGHCAPEVLGIDGAYPTMEDHVKHFDVFKGRGVALVASAAVLALAAGGSGAVAASLITSADIKDKAVKKVDLAENSVVSSKVKDGTLKLKDVGGATERTMDGEITLKLGFLLKPLAMIGEQVIKAEGLKILDGEAPVLQKFVTEVLRQG